MSAASERYQRHMSLLKQRYYYTLPIVQGGLNSIYEVEIAALNIRKMCESIAYGCAIVLTSKRKTAKLQRLLNEYAADKILHEVTNSDPECFPQPIHIEFNFEKHSHQAKKVEGRVPTVKELRDLYRKCHYYLHEYREMVGTNDKIVSDFTDGLHLIKALVSVHMIKCDGVYFIVVLGDDAKEAPLTILAGDNV
jgi:hypothetical protein